MAVLLFGLAVAFSTTFETSAPTQDVCFKTMIIAILGELLVGTVLVGRRRTNLAEVVRAFHNDDCEKDG
jgi:hypothetical protein